MARRRKKWGRQWREKRNSNLLNTNAQEIIPKIGTNYNGHMFLDHDLERKKVNTNKCRCLRGSIMNIFSRHWIPSLQLTNVFRFNDALDLGTRMFGGKACGLINEGKKYEHNTLTRKQ